MDLLRAEGHPGRQRGRRGGSVLSLLLLTLLGCGDPIPSSLADCPDLDCQQRWVEAWWAKDRERVGVELSAVRDPVARIALVRQLTLAHPGEASALCDLLESTQERQACHERNRRPHLQDVQIRGPGGLATAEEEDNHGLKLNRPIPSPWAELAPEALSCSVEARICQSEEARKRAEAGQIEGAAAACNAIDEVQWQAECYFQAAEGGVRRPGAEGGRAIGLCLGASSYAGRCLSHVVRQLGTAAPPASSGDAARWATVREAIEAGAAQLEADPELASAFRAQGWAYALRFAYVSDSAVTGVPLDVLPPEAAPHVRAAIAWRLFSLESTQERDLEAWQARLDEVMADRAPRAPSRAPPPSRTTGNFKMLWAETLPLEAELPRVPFLGSAERALSEDPSQDALICLLEAAAQGRPPGVRVLELGLNHPAALVRWTAVRLLAGVDPRNVRLLRHHDGDELVRARMPSRGP